MTAPRPVRDLDAEREVDLSRWRSSLVTLWWLPVGGLIAGAIIGFLFGLSGGTTYKASALISLGQPVSPGGALVAGFGTNPRAVAQITSSAAAQEAAAHKAGMHPGALRGHVSIGTVGTATGAAATRAAPLISLTVTGKTARKIADAANALADIVVADTTAPYVGTKIKTFKRTLKSVDDQLTAVIVQLRAVSAAIDASKNLDPLQRLVIVSQEDNAETRQGNLIAQQEALQQQLAFAQNVESAKVVEPARAVKSSARSRRTALIIGALIGLILGGIAAIIADARSPRPRPA